MKKILFAVILIASVSGIKAQYAAIDARLSRLEAKRGINKNLKAVDLNQKRFVIQKEFEDHTERLFISLNGDKATYIEVFDDKKTGETTSNVFSGDFIRTPKNIISFRFDALEGKKIPLAITKSFLLTQHGEILYLLDVNTKERWIDEKMVIKK